MNLLPYACGEVAHFGVMSIRPSTQALEHLGIRPYTYRYTAVYSEYTAV